MRTLYRLGIKVYSLLFFAAAMPPDVGMHDLQASCQVTAFARDSRGDGHAYAWQLLGTSHGSTLRPLAVEVPAQL